MLVADDNAGSLLRLQRNCDCNINNVIFIYFLLYHRDVTWQDSFDAQKSFFRYLWLIKRRRDCRSTVSSKQFQRQYTTLRFCLGFSSCYKCTMRKPIPITLKSSQVTYRRLQRLRRYSRSLPKITLYYVYACLLTTVQYLCILFDHVKCLLLRNIYLFYTYSI